MKQNDDNKNNNETNRIKVEKLSAKSRMLEFAQNISIPAFPNLLHPLYWLGPFWTQTLLFFSLAKCVLFSILLLLPSLSRVPRCSEGHIARQGGMAQNPWMAQHPWIPDGSTQTSIPLGEFLACDL